MTGVHSPTLFPRAHGESVATEPTIPPSSPHRAHPPEPPLAQPSPGAKPGQSWSTDFPTSPSWEGSAAENLSQDQRRLRRGGPGAETLPTLPSEAVWAPRSHHIPTTSPPRPHHISMSPARVSSTPRHLQPLGQLRLSQVPPAPEQGKQPWLSPLLFRQD